MDKKRLHLNPCGWKIKYIHSIHSENPTLNKTNLKYAVGLGISAKVISEYWKTYVDPKPVYQIKPIEELAMRERIYIPTERKPDEFYYSFEQMVLFRPDVKAENTTLEVPYICMYKDDYMAGEPHIMVV